MEAMRTARARVVRLESRVVLREGLRKQVQRTVISVGGVGHRLRLVDVRPGTDRNRRTVLITVTTDNTHQCAHVHILLARLDDYEFVASLLAHAMRAVLTGELPADGVEAV
jgi:hypothetical protein